VPAEVAFAFLVDPRNRPKWQSSLRRVEDVTPAEPAVGQRWVDVTTPGFRPAMETTVLVPPVQWTERGTWRSTTAQLTLFFLARPDGCRVRAEVSVTGRFAALLTRLAPYAIGSDLRRAARLLSREARGQ
jgi:hypothetical protein